METTAENSTPILSLYQIQEVALLAAIMREEKMYTKGTLRELVTRLLQPDALPIALEGVVEPAPGSRRELDHTTRLLSELSQYDTNLLLREDTLWLEAVAQRRELTLVDSVYLHQFCADNHIIHVAELFNRIAA